MFEENLINPPSDYKSSKIIDESSKVRLVSKRSVNNDASSDSINNSHATQEVGWWSRVKRAIVNFFSSSDNEETPNVVQSQKTTTPEVKLDELETLPVASKLRKTEIARPKRQHDDDDDDDTEDDDEASGTLDGDPEESTPLSTLPNVKDDKYFRLKFIALEFWNDNLLNKSSQDFKDLATSFQNGLRDLYKEKTGREILASVVEFR